ncbi:hypothetical protein TNCV_27101 [Trichonephila clavipes]|uniref:Uncharacterized protein n=1 Tax=Trichonephila clavipes TaxID=2585209 RepID=A0A8X6WK72_TRICX|nr:hypothetical protein TNCV_27101 [Trichonephila clavipes]
MATPGSSFTSTPLGHEDNLEVRYHPGAKTLQKKKPKARQSSRAGAAKTRTETCEIVEEKQKLLDIRAELEREEKNARVARAGVTF